MNKVLIFVTCILMIGAFKFYQTVKDIEQSNETVKIEYIEVQKCNLHTNECKFELPGVGSFIFEIFPRPIKQNKKLNIKMIKNTLKDVKVWVDFFGVNLNMGYNRPELQLQDSANTFVGETLLPTCSKDLMDWKITVLIKSSDKVYGVVYKVQTKKENQ